MSRQKVNTNSNQKLYQQNKGQHLNIKMFQQNKEKNPKSSLLWNVVDPDDPYDIRKSMIARLPDHTQNFMGGNLEIVCLMQAAQIQRLSENLAQNQLKYRQLQRKQLDRHSYQIQIKQLSERANQSSKYRTQIQKLREYIKKLTLQLQQVSQNSSSASALQIKYDELYKKYQALLIQLQNSRQNIDTLNINVNKLLEENKQSRIKYDKLDKLRLTQITQEREKYQVKIRERIQLEVKEVQARFGVRIAQLESDCRLYREQIQSKNHQLTSYISRNQSLRRQLDSKEKQRISQSDYEQKMSELQRINVTLSQKAMQLQQIYLHYENLQARLRETQKSWRQCQQQNRYYKTQIQKINQQRDADEERDGKIMIQLENKTALMSQQIERLSLLIEGKNKEIRQHESRLNTIRFDYQNRTRVLTSEYEEKLSLKRQSTQKIEQLQSELRPLRQLTIQLKLKNEMLTKQLTSASLGLKRIDQLQTQLKNADLIISQKNDHICKLEAWLKNNEVLAGENMALRSALSDVSRIFRSIEEIYGISGLGQRDGTVDIKQMDMMLKNISRTAEQKQELKKQLEKQVLINHDISSKMKLRQRELSEVNQNLNKLKNQVKQIKKANQQYELDIRKGTLITAQTLDTTIKRAISQTRANLERQMGAQIQRAIDERQRALHDSVSQKKIFQQQIMSLQEKLERKTHEQEQLKVHAQTRYLNQIHDLTTSLKALRQENERTMNEKNKLKNILGQIQKQMAVKQRQQFEQARDLNRKLQQLRMRNEQLQQTQTRLSQDLIQSQEKLSVSYKQSQQRVSKIYLNQIQDKDNSIASLERQLKNSRDQLKSIQEYDQKVRGDLKNYRDRLLKASQQLDRLNEILTAKNNQISILNNRISSMEPMYIQQLSQKDEELRRLKGEIGSEENIRKQLQSKQQQNRTLKSHIASLQNLHRQHLHQKQIQIQSTTSQLQSLQNENHKLYTKFQSLDEKYQKSQNQIKNETQSLEIIQRYKRQLSQKIQQLQYFKNVMENSQAQVERLKRQKIEDVRSVEIRYQRIIKEKQMEIENEKGQKGMRLGHQRDMIEKSLRVQYQAKNKQIVQRQFRVSAELANAQRQIQHLQTELSNLQREHNKKTEQIQTLKSELTTLLNKITTVQSQQSSSNQPQLQQQLQQQQYEIRNLKQMLQQIEQISAHTLSERDALLNSMQMMKNQIQRYRTVLREKQREDVGVEGLRNKIGELNGLCARYQEQVRRLEGDVDGIARRSRGYEEQLALAVSQLERLNQILRQRDRQIQRLKSEDPKASEQFQATLVQTQKQLSQSRQQLSFSKNEIASLKDQQAQLQLALNQSTNKFTQLQQQLSQSQNELTQTKTQFFSIQTQYTSLQTQYTSLQAQYTSLQTQYTSLHHQHSVMQQQYSQYSQTEYQELQIENKNLKQMLEQMQQINLHTVAQRDQLFQLSHQYKQQTDGFRSRINQKEVMYEDLLRKFNGLKMENGDVIQQIRRYESQIQVIVKQNKNYQSKIQQLVSQMQRLGKVLQQRQQRTSQMAHLHDQLQQLSILLQTRTQQSNEWQQKYTQLYKTHKQSIQMLNNKLSEYQKKIIILNKQFQELSSKLKYFKEENSLLTQKLKIIDQLVDKNKILGVEIDRLNEVVEGYKGEIDDTRHRLANQMALERRIQEDLALMVILFAEIQTMRTRLSQSQMQCENVRRSSLTPHRVDRQTGRSLDSRGLR